MKTTEIDYDVYLKNKVEPLLAKKAEFDEAIENIARVITEKRLQDEITDHEERQLERLKGQLAELMRDKSLKAHLFGNLQEQRTEAERLFLEEKIYSTIEEANRLSARVNEAISELRGDAILQDVARKLQPIITKTHRACSESSTEMKRLLQSEEHQKNVERLRKRFNSSISEPGIPQPTYDEVIGIALREVHRHLRREG